MAKQGNAILTTYSAIMAIICWFALVAQLILSINTKTAPIAELIARYFTYYTILTNILVALCFTFLMLKPASASGKFFTKPATFTATTVYITIVCVVYNLILRFTWNPQGLQRIVDEFLHLIIPVMFILLWFMFVPKGQLKWKNVLPWLIYPLVYLFVVLIRGALSGFYPYPFIDVNTLGYAKTLINAGGLTIAFVLLALLFVLIDGFMSRRANI